MRLATAGACVGRLLCRSRVVCDPLLAWLHMRHASTPNFVRLCACAHVRVVLIERVLTWLLLCACCATSVRAHSRTGLAEPHQGSRGSRGSSWVGSDLIHIPV